MIVKPRRVLDGPRDDSRLQRNRFANPLLKRILEGPRLVLDVSVGPLDVTIALMFSHWEIVQECILLPLAL